MQTKRCTYCHKLQRADAQVCSLCGQTFVRKKPVVRNVTAPSIPQASAHRAGHYFGLHPEDQPYQSNKIVVRRPPVDEAEQVLQPEPELIIFPDTDEAPVMQVYRATTHSRSDRRSDAAVVKVSPPPYMPHNALLSPRATSLILAMSCIFFLLASSIIAFVLIRSHTASVEPAVQASPNLLHVGTVFTLTGHGFGSRDLMAFTIDNNQIVMGLSGKPLIMHTNEQGVFSVKIRVPDGWNVGTHTIYTLDEAQGSSVPTRIIVNASV